METSNFFDGQDLSKLRQWLYHYLGKLHEDPRTFTDYVITLLPSEGLNKKRLTHELRDFLDDDTEKFVNALYDTMQTKSYMIDGSGSCSARNGTHERARESGGSSSSSSGISGDSRASPYYQQRTPSDRGENAHPAYSGDVSSSSSSNNKRDRHSRDRIAPRSDDRYYRDSDRDRKRRRRFSPSHRDEPSSYRRHRESRVDRYSDERRYDRRSGGGRGYGDDSDLLESDHDRNERRHPRSSTRGISPLDTNERLHGPDRDVRRPRLPYSSSRGRGSEYVRGRGRGRGGRREGPTPPESYLPKRTAEEWAKLEEEMKDNKCTIVVSSIPPEHSNHEQLQTYFSQFGKILNMSVKKHLHRAFIQFENFDDAMKAVKSPGAIFGNRFIKVNFARKQNYEIQSSAEGAKGSSEAGNNFVASGSAPGSNTYISPAAMEQLKKEQQLQHIQQQQMQLQQQIQRQQQQKQLEKERTLLQTRLDLRKVLTEKLDTAEDKMKLITELKDLDTKISESLERVKKEATASHGTAQFPPSPPVVSSSSTTEASSSASEAIGTELSSEIPATDSNKGEISEFAEGSTVPEISPSYRGRGRGYRGGLWRGGASPPFRGRGRGGFRGGRGGASMKLENRTSTFVVQNIPETKRNAGALNEHFSSFGKIVAMEAQDSEDKAVIQFATRQSAERAISQGKQLEDQTLRFTWQQAPLSSQVDETQTQQNSEHAPVASSDGGHSRRERNENDNDEDIYTYDEDDDEDGEKSWKR